MFTNDFIYCEGKGCMLRQSCLRYTEGEKLKEVVRLCIDHCGEELRELYIDNNK